MPDFDLLIRGAANIPLLGITGGKIAGFEEGSAREEIDAGGLLILPGLIDAHVHFNEPGRADWEGAATGSRACAAGGTTTFFDMPLNAHPPTCNAESFALKRAVMEAGSWVDFALWGGLIPGNLDQLEALRDCGVIGLKAFMSGSGIEDFPKADLRTLKAGMKRAAALGLLVAVHAEIDHPELARGESVDDYLASRPVAMELEAVSIALEMAGETGCRLHVVHVSSAEGVALIAAARARGLDVSCETCPHYLTLTGDDVRRLGASAKCAPPLRSEPERRALLERVLAGDVDTIGSDHSPSPPAMKTDANFFKVWGGISSCQHLLLLLLSLELPIELIAKLAAAHAAERFGIAHRKGALMAGLDADLVLVAPAENTVVSADSLFYRHRQTPYLGRQLRGRVAGTFLRGRPLHPREAVPGRPGGSLITPRL